MPKKSLANLINFYDNTLNKLVMKKKFLNKIKVKYQMLIGNTTFTVKFWCFLLRSGMTLAYPLSPLIINVILNVQAKK